MSIYYITDTEVTTATELDSYIRGGVYTVDERITVDIYKRSELTSDDTIIYDLNLALNEDDSTINIDRIWEDLVSNLTTEISSLVFYADDKLENASWENIIFKKDDSSKFPIFQYLSFDGPNVSIMEFYDKIISVEITGWDTLSKIDFQCLTHICNLDISDNGLTIIDFDEAFDGNIKSITMKNMIIDDPDSEILISQPTLEYLNITNSSSSKLTLSLESLKEIDGFTPSTLIGDNPKLTISNFKLPINLDNFPSNISITIYNIDYFPTGLDSIEKINSLNIENCKNINEIKNLYINNCYSVYLTYVYKLNKIKINDISEYIVDDENKNAISMIANIDLVSLELPKQKLTDATVILYANINLSEIICNGISYGKEDDKDNDLLALCRELELLIYTSSGYSNDKGKHRLGFNKLYISREDFYNINPQIYKDRELIGEPLTGDSIDDILKYKDIKYSYIKLPKVDDIIKNTSLMEMLVSNVIDYSNNDVIFTSTEYYAFVALGLNGYTARSFVENLDNYGIGAIVFTDRPKLLTGVKNHKVINPFNGYFFKINLVVY